MFCPSFARLFVAAAGLCVVGASSALASCTTPSAWTGGATSMFNTCGWGDAQRLDFYKRDQGSRLIPLSWLRALARPDGVAFLSGGLEKYGYLPNPDSHSNPFAANDVSLPVGFTLSGADATAVVGMTCSACHTRELTYGNSRLRIDGGPAIVDFQSFLSDLNAAVGSVLAGSQFDAFAHQVLGAAATPAQVAQLRQDVQAWYTDFNAITSRALPDAQHGWGLGRLDAVSMIFDRVAGLDIAPGGHGALAANIYPADAPVRYPFIWNANLQDRTQWPGFAQNGNDLFALLRNLGEVYGVFGVLRPQRLWPPLGFSALGAPIINFIGHNSAAFDNLAQLENLLKKIPSPAWPEAMLGRNSVNLARGKAVFDESCASCHGVKQVALQPWLWQTPLKNAGTDTREWSVLDRKAPDPGLLDGMIDITTLTNGHPATIGKNSKEFAILANTVLRSVLEHALLGQSWQPAVVATGPVAGLEANMRAMFIGQGALSNSEVQQAVQRPEFADLRNAYTTKPPTTASAAPATETPVYEARVLSGIWSTAPYLHNGSVATLADLLRPSCTDAQAAQDAANHQDSDRQCRRVSFAVGSNYDPVAVGLAVGQPNGAPVRVTTDASALNSGNSRAGHEGHEFGTDLPADDKAALLGYLKTL